MGFWDKSISTPFKGKGDGMSKPTCFMEMPLFEKCWTDGIIPSVWILREAMSYLKLSSMPPFLSVNPNFVVTNPL